MPWYWIVFGVQRQDGGCEYGITDQPPGVELRARSIEDSRGFVSEFRIDTVSDLRTIVSTFDREENRQIKFINCCKAIQDMLLAMENNTRGEIVMPGEEDNAANGGRVRRENNGLWDAPADAPRDILWQGIGAMMQMDVWWACNVRNMRQFE